jgi:putative glycosyltransferase (TIGR04372 family)
MEAKKTFYEKIIYNIWPLNTVKRKGVRCGTCDVIAQNYLADGLCSKRNLNVLIKGVLFIFANTGLLPFVLLLRIFNFKIITGTTFFQVGEIILLDAIIKRNYLQQKKHRYLFMHIEKFYDNQYLINLYGKHLVFIKNRPLLFFVLLMSHSIFLRENVVNLDTNCETCELSEILNTYRDKFVAPLIEIPGADKELSMSELSRFIDSKNKFVCIHARESGYKSNLYKDENRTTRNSNIETYGAVIDLLVSKGYIVVRMGDSSMSRTSKFAGKFGNNFFDYAHSTIKSSRMDAYLFSQCEFSLVCNSGPSEIPSIFNRSIVTLNGYTAVNALRFYEGDVAIFKKITNKITGKYLNLYKLFEHPFDQPLQADELNKFGYYLVDNDETEILNAVKFYFKCKSDQTNSCPNGDFVPPLLSSHFAWGARAKYADSFIMEYIANQERADSSLKCNSVMTRV